MSHPRRIQRKRGVKLPPNTCYVGRPTFYGNPFKVGVVPGLGGITPSAAVELYRTWLDCASSGRLRAAAARRVLRGKNLACWCPLDQPCHADVLLEIANR